MACNFVLSPFFLFSLLLSYASAQPSRALLSPVTAIPNLPLFTLSLNTNEQYFIHIGGPFLVRRCDDGRSRPTVACFSAPCVQSRRFSPEMCPPPNNTVVNNRCACEGTAFDPFTNQCRSNRFTNGNFVISSTNINHVYYLCAPVPFAAGFPPGVFGVAGLSPSTLAMWNQFARFPNKKFALCLPSSDNPNDKGFILFGGGPYERRVLLTYTPLIRNPKRLNNYYIGLRGISVNGKDIALGPNALGFDSNGDGGVMLSTVVPYTTLRSDVYSILVNEFSNATNKIPRANNVSPFGLCLDTSSIGTVQAGLNVPRVDLKLNNGGTWAVYGANSMKKVGDNVACLGFVDGGATAKQAVVIGTYQMESNLVVFDNGRSAVGFSSSLSLVKSSCSKFQI